MPQTQMTDERYYTDEEVQDALNNSTLALLRWDKLKDFKEVRGRSLREFVTELVNIITEETLKDEGTGQLLLPPGEIALAFQAASLLVLYKYVWPTEDKGRKSFIRGLMRG